jgi:hypothetical protein
MEFYTHRLRCLLFHHKYFFFILICIFDCLHWCVPSILHFRMCIDRHDLSWYIFMSAYVDVCHASILHFRFFLDTHEDELQIIWERMCKHIVRQKTKSTLYVSFVLNKQPRKDADIANYMVETTNDYKQTEATQLLNPS